jgi:DNA-binding response OmpR family regulator
MQVQFSDSIEHRHGASAIQDFRRSDHAQERSDPGVISFGRFRAIPKSRQLLMDGNPQEIGGRAFDLLMVLLKSNGGIVSKDEIFNFVWPSMVVEECNLRFQIKTLRRALGDHGQMIKTIVRRGYMLVRDEVTPHVDTGPADVIVEASARIDDESQTPHVVLIDDDEGVRRAISSLIRSVGLAITCFGSVSDYQESALYDQPACMILDACLPGMSGLEFQADLMKTGLLYPIIFISGHADVQMSVRAMKAGAVEFLTKPVRHQELLSAVDLAVSQMQVQRPALGV